MSNEKLSRIFYITASALAVIILAFICLEYVLPIVFPFIIAWGIAYIMRPPARAIAEKTKIPQRVVAPALSIIVLLLLLGGIIWAGSAIVSELRSLAEEILRNGNIKDKIAGLLHPLSGLIGSGIPEDFLDYLGSGLSGFFENIVSSIASGVGDAVAAVPGILFFILITVISCIYFSIDLDNINRFVISHIPKKWSEFLLRAKKNTLSIASRYIRSCLVIMLITFLLMLIGFLILRVQYALLLAVIVALLDALPVLGVGTILVPYSVISFIGGNIELGIGLLILYGVNEILRQVIEPKILGKHLGVHPLITIIFLYAGYTTLGFLGIILLPVFAVLVNSLIQKPKSADIE